MGPIPGERESAAPSSDTLCRSHPRKSGFPTAAPIPAVPAGVAGSWCRREGTGGRALRRPGGLVNAGATRVPSPNLLHRRAPDRSSRPRRERQPPPRDSRVPPSIPARQDSAELARCDLKLPAHRRRSGLAPPSTSLRAKCSGTRPPLRARDGIPRLPRRPAGESIRVAAAVPPPAPTAWWETGPAPPSWRERRESVGYCWGEEKAAAVGHRKIAAPGGEAISRSEEHTSELQSHSDLVCRLLLEKKNTEKDKII